MDAVVRLRFADDRLHVYGDFHVLRQVPQTVPVVAMLLLLLLLPQADKRLGRTLLSRDKC